MSCLQFSTGPAASCKEVSCGLSLRRGQWHPFEVCGSVVLGHGEGVCTASVASSVDIARGIKIEMGREGEYEGWGT